MLAMLPDPGAVSIQQIRNWCQEAADNRHDRQSPMSADIFVERYTSHSQASRNEESCNGRKGQGRGCIYLVGVNGVHVCTHEDIDQAESEQGSSDNR